MPHSPSILVYGREPNLLQSRRWVFEVGGFRVSCAKTLEEARQAAVTRSFDLLVLCHTLSQQDYRDALAWARTLPAMRRLVLLAGTVLTEEWMNEAVLSQFAGPRELVSAANRVLAPRAAAPGSFVTDERRGAVPLTGTAHQ